MVEVQSKDLAWQFRRKRRQAPPKSGPVPTPSFCPRLSHAIPSFPPAPMSSAVFSKPLHPDQLISLFRRHKSTSQVIFVVLLILRSRLVPSLNQKRRKEDEKKGLTAHELGVVLQTLFTEEEGTRGKKKKILVPYNNRLSRVPYDPTPQDFIDVNQEVFLHQPSQDSEPSEKEKKKKHLFDPVFLRTLRLILFRIVFPLPNKPSLFSTLTSPVTLTVSAYTSFLILRTYLSILVAKLDGMIVRDLVRADGRGFAKGLALWYILAVPSILVNVMIRHMQGILSEEVRGRLTRFITDLYLGVPGAKERVLRYYKIQQSSSSVAAEGVDQYITSDIEAFSEGLSGLYGNLLKPSLDLLLFTSQLSRSLGVRGTVMLFGTYWATVHTLRALSPAFGRLSAVEARLEGEYRAGMGRLGRGSEEVAFYDGGARERDILTRAYMRLIKHVNSIYKIRIAYEWTEDYVIKYLWSAAGYGLIAVPLLFTRALGGGAKGAVAAGAVAAVGAVASSGSSDINGKIASRTQTYISNRRLLLSLADAGGRLMYAYKDILEMQGVVGRLGGVIRELYACGLPPPATPEVLITPPSADSSWTFDAASSDEAQELKVDEDDYDDDESIVVRSVDIAIPGTTTVLVKNLSFRLRRGEHLMITGSNGVGKTAVCRVLGGLWDVEGRGTVKTPEGSKVMFIPQRTYHPQGTLLDQVIYPYTYPEFLERWKNRRAAGETTDADPMSEIEEILHAVYLGYLPEREGGWLTRKEWRDVLSGGEKQRISLARVLYHRPLFAVLDEATSAVSSDVEGRLYETIKRWGAGIGVVSVSLRPSLQKYHTHQLTIHGDGSGGWEFTQLSSVEAQTSKNNQAEIEELEARLREVEEWERRIGELDVMLQSHGDEA
ncbi:ATP-binding cassette long-chain fatty acid transporter pxa1 [Paramarasmius palmivorus]|uniref:ATP-binding cassette long-chain fatty acid transporter pxa1 n=1 Tax=Paramarasmius palmivorus TaxID=297713 RepID=A0AAW0CTD8_9AGAR